MAAFAPIHKCCLSTSGDSDNLMSGSHRAPIPHAGDGLCGSDAAAPFAQTRRYRPTRRARLLRRRWRARLVHPRAAHPTPCARRLRGLRHPRRPHPVRCARPALRDPQLAEREGRIGLETQTAAAATHPSPAPARRYPAPPAGMSGGRIDFEAHPAAATTLPPHSRHARSAPPAAASAPSGWGQRALLPTSAMLHAHCFEHVPDSRPK